MRKILLSVFAVSLFILTSSVVSAQGPEHPPTHPPKPLVNLKDDDQGGRGDLDEKLASRSGKTGTNSANLQNRCQVYETVIKNKSDSMVKMAQNMQNVFNSIAQRVEQFYTTKLIPEGKIVPNYDTLVANVASSSAAVDTAVSAANTDAANFTCSSTDPKGEIKGFGTTFKGVSLALKNYRTSIRILIQAVFKAASVGHEATSSAEPSATPL